MPGVILIYAHFQWRLSASQQFEIVSSCTQRRQHMQDAILIHVDFHGCCVCALLTFTLMSFTVAALRQVFITFSHFRSILMGAVSFRTVPNRFVTFNFNIWIDSPVCRDQIYCCWRGGSVGSAFAWRARCIWIKSRISQVVFTDEMLQLDWAEC